MAPPRFNVCDYLGFLLISYCAVPIQETRIQKRTSDGFQVEYQWSYINYTWPSIEEYKDAVYTKRYIPENNVISGMKFYKDRIYFALPRVRSGVPATLAYFSTKTKGKTNLPLTPFPSWSTNVQSNCATLQNAQNIEIDRRGIMWVLDGMRINSFTTCPSKLVLLDLNQRGKVVHAYTFRDEISLRLGGYMNDLVIDESDGGYAYITDSSAIDPGLVVYSRQQGRAWKLRDKSMFAESDASNFTIDNTNITGFVGITGIALSPLPKNRDDERLVYYTALNGYNMFAISSRILKNEVFCRTDQWRRYVRFVGRKTSQSDGLIIENSGNMYFGLLTSNSVGKWNIYDQFTTAKQFDFNPQKMIWPDSFAMDSSGNLYLLTNSFIKYLDTSQPLTLTSQLKFRILKTYTGNKNYMYSGK